MNLYADFRNEQTPLEHLEHFFRIAPRRTKQQVSSLVAFGHSDLFLDLEHEAATGSARTAGTDQAPGYFEYEIQTARGDQGVC